MTKEKIRDILKRYWNCETDLEEEKILKEYFLGENVEDELQSYKSLFVADKEMSCIKAGNDLKKRIKNSLRRKEKEAKKIKKDFRLTVYQFTKVAACILVVLSFGIGMRTHYKQQEALDEKFSETYSNPEDAMEETKGILDKVSISLKNNPEIEETLESDTDSIGGVDEE